MKDFQINILGTVYYVCFKKREDDKCLQQMDGYTDWTARKIVVLAKNDEAVDDVANFEKYQKQICRHEIIHAFLFESGLGANLEHQKYGHEETMVDWLAFQFPKMNKIFTENGLI